MANILNSQSSLEDPNPATLTSFPSSGGTPNSASQLAAAAFTTASTAVESSTEQHASTTTHPMSESALKETLKPGVSTTEKRALEESHTDNAGGDAGDEEAGLIKSLFGKGKMVGKAMKVGAKGMKHWIKDKVESLTDCSCFSS